MTGNTEATYEFGSFKFRSARCLLTRGGEPVHLTMKAGCLLLALLERRGEVVSKNELIQAVWPDTFVGDSNLTFHVYLVRQALGETGDEPRYIETLPRRGYRFIAPVVETRLGGSEGVAPDAHELVVRPPAPDLAPIPVDAGSGKAPAVRFAWTPILLTIAGVVILVGSLLLSSGMVIRSPMLRVIQQEPLTDSGVFKEVWPLLTDGARVYYRGATATDIQSVPVAGGDSLAMFQAPGDFLLSDLNPDRSEYLALRAASTGADRELWILPAKGGTPRRVGNALCSAAAWAPDASRIACVTGRILYVMTVEGRNATKVTEIPAGEILQPRWSPDSARLRFTIQTGIDSVVSTAFWEVRADGSRLRRILLGAAVPPDVCCGNWTPSADFFVFQATYEGRTDIWALPERRRWFGMDAQPVQLTSGTLSFGAPVVSRDGKMLFAVGRPTQGELVRYEPDAREFSLYLRGISGTWVTFSPDRQSVAYVGMPDRRLWRSNVDGTNKRQLTFGPFEVDGSSWSPDGKLIAFLSRMRGTQLRIFLMPADGGEPQPISAEDKAQGIPSWSPDGTRIVYGDVPFRYGHPQGDEVLHIYNLARREVTTVPGSERLWTVRWSPDGRHLSAVTIVGRVLRIFDLETQVWRSLPVDHVDNTIWSHDGQFVYYTAEGGRYELRRVHVATGRAETLIDFAHTPQLATWWTGLTPDGAPIFLRSLGAPQIYALRLEVR